MTAIDLMLSAQVVRLSPRGRVATVRLPAVGRGHSFRPVSGPGGDVTERQYGDNGRGRRIGIVVAVRPTGSGTEVDLRVTGDSAWQRLAEGRAVEARCAFTGSRGPDVYGGQIQRVEIG